MTDDAQFPAVRASDAEREALVARLQTAVGEGRLDLDEFAQRADAAYAAVTLDDLAALVADLPGDRLVGAATTGEIVGRREPQEISSVFGDVVLSAVPGLPRRASTVFGDVRIDLRGLRTSDDRVDLHLGTVFGDVDVVVSEGVDAELLGRTFFGDRKVELASVPRLAGTPLVVVHGRTVFGDLRLRSLPPGVSASRWKALMERLTARKLP